MIREIRKKLSANDVGSTGAHQAGILVPKEPRVLAFFPVLDKAVKNPRMTLSVREPAGGAHWNFNFIYYNNRFFGGTRNEYRLTCMTNYLRSANVHEGDELVFSRDENASYNLELVRQSSNVAVRSADGVLVLSGGWKIISIN
jgi:hypothetical protein